MSSQSKKALMQPRKPSAGPTRAGPTDNLLAELEALKTESSARAEELKTLQASLDKVRRERDALKLANEDLRVMNEENEEDLKWYMSQLSLLQRERNEEKVMRWLEGAQGLSTVRGLAGTSQPLAASSVTDAPEPSPHSRARSQAHPPHCTDPDLWMRGEALPGDLEDLQDADQFQLQQMQRAAQDDSAVSSSVQLGATQVPATPGRDVMAALRVSGAHPMWPPNNNNNTDTTPRDPAADAPQQQQPPAAQHARNNSSSAALMTFPPKHPQQQQGRTPSTGQQGGVTRATSASATGTGTAPHAATRNAEASEMNGLLDEIWDKVQDGVPTTASRNAPAGPSAPAALDPSNNGAVQLDDPLQTLEGGLDRYPSMPTPADRLNSLPMAVGREPLPRGATGGEASTADIAVTAAVDPNLIASFRARMEQLEGQLAAAQSEKFELLRDLSDIRAELDEASKRCESLTADVAARDARVTELQSKVTALEARTQERVQQETRSQLEQATQVEEREREVRALLARAQAAEAKLQKVEIELLETTALRDLLTDKLAQSETAHEASTAALQQELREERIKGDKHRKKVAELEAFVAHASQTTQSYADQLQRSQEQNATLQRELSRQRTISNKRTDAEANVQALSQSHAELEGRYREALAVGERLNKLVGEKEKELAAKEEAMGELREQVGALEGKIGSLEGSLQQQKELAGSLDTQLALMREKYEQLSLRAAAASSYEPQLEETKAQLFDLQQRTSRIQNQTAELQADLATAREQYTSTHRLMTAATLDLQLTQEDLVRAFVDAAVTRVMAREHQAKCSEALVIAEGLQRVNLQLEAEIARLHNAVASQNTESGALVRQMEEARRTLTALQSSLGQRSRELEESREQCSGLEKQLAEEREQVRQMQYAVNRSNERVRDQEKSCKEMSDRVSEADARVKEVNERIQQVQERLSSSRAQCTTLTQQVAELTAARDQMTAKCTGLESRLFDSQKRARLLENKVKDVTERLNKATAELHQLKHEPPSTPFDAQVEGEEGEGGEGKAGEGEGMVTPAKQLVMQTPSGDTASAKSGASRPASGASTRTPANLPRAGSASVRRVPSNGRLSVAPAATVTPSALVSTEALERLKADVSARDARIQALLTMSEERSSMMRDMQNELVQQRATVEEQRAREKKKDSIIKKLYAEVQACHAQISELGGQMNALQLSELPPMSGRPSTSGGSGLAGLVPASIHIHAEPSASNAIRPLSAASSRDSLPPSGRESSRGPPTLPIARQSSGGGPPSVSSPTSSLPPLMGSAEPAGPGVPRRISSSGNPGRLSSGGGDLSLSFASPVIPLGVSNNGNGATIGGTTKNPLMMLKQAQSGDS